MNRLVIAAAVILCGICAVVCKRYADASERMDELAATLRAEQRASVAELERALQRETRARREAERAAAQPAAQPFVEHEVTGSAAVAPRARQTREGAVDSSDYRAEAERKHRAFLGELDVIVRDGRPSDWRPEQEITRALASIATIRELRCASDLCRIEVERAPNEDPNEWSSRFRSAPPFASGTLYDPSAEGTRLILYVARPDVGFPEL
jgi:hypothetical protein